MNDLTFRTTQYFILALLLIVSPCHGETSKHYLSFIMPAYNRAHTIREAVDSIYAQTDLDIPFEVICIDDCSTDNTREVLQEYGNKHNNFHAYFHDVNLGASEARNTAIGHAKGDLIFNLDSDNILEANSISKLVKYMKEKGCEAACFQETRFFTKNRKKTGGEKYYLPDNICSLIDLFTPKPSDPENTKGWSGNKTPLSGGNYLFTRKSWERAGKYTKRMMETWAFGVRQLASGTTIAVLPNSFYWHRVGDPSSNWAVYQKNHINDLRCLETLTKEVPEIFSPETISFLESYDVTKRKLHHDVGSGNFELIPSQALTHLFEAYKLEQDGKLDEAKSEYELAIECGAWHNRVAERYKKIHKIS